ncbi:MAG TPA: TonB-dependent receptor [Candidatus Acidoferrales bacterium]|nr:TonB-dependent receptor [Candidatus Acidoferrales bacterium]
MRRVPSLVVFCFLAPLIAHAQSTNASLSGRLTDSSKARIAGARVAATDIATNIRNEVTTNTSGEYYLPNLAPGTYRMEVEKPGFQKMIRPNVILHVQDVLSIDFEMRVGSASERITVEGGAPLLNTSDAAVSTLVDNRFVENLPLNGRSFSALIDLTPGVVLVNNNFFEEGQFSVNGQRPDANYFTVDGVSANLGTPVSSFGQGGTGQLPATSAFGGLSNLVSLDALQEFRIQTSTFAPEFGRTPGAQVSVVTKSGTNAFHGTAFEYLRNDVLDANGWFADNEGLRKPALRQNDFGGVLGGPIIKDRLFFFGSYEGVRVRQPQIANTYVPTLATRQSAVPAVQPLLNAFPLPTGGACPNCPAGTAAFAAGYSDPASLDSYSGKFDYALSRRVSLFGRYSDAPSSTVQRGGGRFRTAYTNLNHTKARTQTMTAGANQTITQRAINELRFNYSLSHGQSFLTLDNFAGAVAPPDSVLFPAGQSSNNSFLGIFGDFNPFGLLYDVGKIADNRQHQINVTDNFFWSTGSHRMKFGVDYRRLNPEEGSLTYQLEYEFLSLANFETDSVPAAFVASRSPDVQLVISNWGLFAQDTWSVARNLTLTYGLRWDYNTAPSSPNGTTPFTVNEVSNLSTATIAPVGTPLWHPQKHNFAPRLGLAWQVRPKLVFRAGAGIFYDLGYSDITNVMISFPYIQEKPLILGTSFPLDFNDAKPPVFITDPPAAVMSVVNPSHVLPRTYEWNAAVEHSITNADVLTLTYVGAAGRKLMRKDIYIAPGPNFTGEFDLLSNHGTSNYDALQAQYRHRLSHGLQTLLSYTWGHSIDDVSSDVNYQNVPLAQSPSLSERGPSDYDIRNTFTGAVSYDIPGPGSGVLKQVFGNWSTDSILYARSAPPVNVVTGQNPFAGSVLSGADSVQRPDIVPNAPFYLSPSGAPGGKVINPAAFTTPVPATAQGDLGRNALRGFGATQWDITLRRQFRFTERFSLQARGDFFNILNHPNFGSPINYLSSPQFGQATQMLNSYLGSGGQSGGLNPLYQIGGPRSIQLALKLVF